MLYIFAAAYMYQHAGNIIMIRDQLCYTDLRPLTTTLAMLGKVGASGAFSIIYIWSAELFPTTVRNSLMGTSSASARVGSMSASYIAQMVSGCGQHVRFLMVG